jgi:hypothetical protein
MNINNIKTLLSNGEIPADKINPIINALSIGDLDKLSELETSTLYEILNNILVLIQDPTSGAHIENLEKANALLAGLS